MSFEIFDTTDVDELDTIVSSAPKDLNTLRALAARIGTAMPDYLIKYLESDLRNNLGILAIHASSSIKGYKTADQNTISRRQGFIGTPQLEEWRFGRNIKHHIKILHNGKGRGRVFYKNLGGVQFVQNTAV